ncbi:hypothetical protein L1987_28342 [Smallanthus sonchifolius]|uniref:Uncharacterized protein n=1 Tax=Smallanthus sonchifolius TaxID=185202 RepID=A0ACB9HYQ2_9ASTR|nr:hypothetical protein L1987_28342 [Smallanthus sonchifolius]
MKFQLSRRHKAAVVMEASVPARRLILLRHAKSCWGIGHLKTMIVLSVKLEKLMLYESLTSSNTSVGFLNLFYQVMQHEQGRLL